MNTLMRALSSRFLTPPKADIVMPPGMFGEGFDMVMIRHAKLRNIKRGRKNKRK